MSKPGKIIIPEIQDKDCSFQDLGERFWAKPAYDYFKSDIINEDVITCLDKIDEKYKCDVIIAYPPYNIGKDFGKNKDFMEIKEYIK